MMQVRDSTYLRNDAFCNLSIHLGSARPALIESDFSFLVFFLLTGIGVDYLA